MTPQMQALITELEDDKYDVLTAEQVANSLNTSSRSKERTTIAGADIWKAIDEPEFALLTARQQQQIRDLWTLGGSIDIASGSKARILLDSLFGAPTRTRAGLTAAIGQSISRAQELNTFTPVAPGHVEEARRLADKAALLAGTLPVGVYNAKYGSYPVDPRDPLKGPVGRGDFILEREGS